MTTRPPPFPPVGLPLGAGAAVRIWPGIVASRKGAARPAGGAALFADQGQGGRAPRLAAPTGPGPRSRPLRMWLAGGAVVLSTALHGGLVAALVALTGTVPPLAEPDVETAEVALISEAKFMAMTAPQPDLPALAPALAAPAALAALAELSPPQTQPQIQPPAPPLPALLPPPDLSAVTPDPAPQVEAAPKPAAAPDIAPPPAPPKAEGKPKADAKPKAKPPAPPENQPRTAEKAKPAPAAPAQQKPAKAAPAPAASQGAAEAKALKADWGAKVRARITRKLALPAGAVPGRAKLRVTVTPKGALVQVEIAQSSGQPALDAAAVRAARAAAPYPHAPKGLTEPSYSFVVPIRLDG